MYLLSWLPGSFSCQCGFPELPEASALLCLNSFLWLPITFALISWLSDPNFQESLICFQAVIHSTAEPGFSTLHTLAHGSSSSDASTHILLLQLSPHTLLFGLLCFCVPSSSTTELLEAPKTLSCTQQALHQYFLLHLGCTPVITLALYISEFFQSFLRWTGA